MTRHAAADELARQHKAAERAMWALGDYHAFREGRPSGSSGRCSSRRAGSHPVQRVLDVAAGTGNVAIRAAAAGADVVASDLTPENFEAGRARGARAGSGARVGRGRRRGAALSRRRVRRRHLVVRRDVRSRSPEGGRRAAARLPARRHDRHAQLHARRAGGRASSTPWRATRRRLRRAPCRRSCGGARSTCGSCSATGSALARTDPQGVRRAGGAPARVRRALQDDLRAGDRPLRLPRRPAEARCRARQRVPRVRHARERGAPEGPAEYRYEYLLVVARKGK